MAKLQYVPLVLFFAYITTFLQEKFRGLIKLSYPMEHGVIKDWDMMEAIWRHVYDELKHVNPKESPVLLTEPPNNPFA